MPANAPGELGLSNQLREVKADGWGDMEEPVRVFRRPPDIAPDSFYSHSEVYVNRPGIANLVLH